MAAGSETPRAGFLSAISVPDADIDLTNASLQIAREEYPALDVGAYAARVDRLADRTREALPRRHGIYDALHAVSMILFEQDRFSGNRHNYYDPRNSYLCDVIDRKTGIPISLSLLYSGIALKIGYRLAGIGLPGHFVLMAGEGVATIYVDAFNQGGLLTAAECRRISARAVGQKADLGAFLKPLSNRSILHRALNNLKQVYLRAEDHPRALAAAERIQLLEPDAWENLGDLAKLQTEAGDFVSATESLTRYLQLAPADGDTFPAQLALEAIREASSEPDSAFE